MTPASRSRTIPTRSACRRSSPTGTGGAKAGRLLRAFCCGEGISMAITEPQSGSDVGSTRTSAKKVDGGYVLNGRQVLHHERHALLGVRGAGRDESGCGLSRHEPAAGGKKRRRGERRQARGQDGHPPVGHGRFRDGGRVRPRRPPDRHGGQRLCPDHEIPRRQTPGQRGGRRRRGAARAGSSRWTTPGSAASSTGRSQNSRAFSS